MIPTSTGLRPQLVRLAPVLASLLIAMVSWMSLPAYYVPDTTGFLKETPSLGQPEEWHVIAPLYPMFLEGLHNSIPAPARMPLIILLQLLAVVLTCYTVLRIGELFQAGRSSWWAAWFVALYGPGYLIAHTTQTESLYVGLTAAAVLATARAMRAQKSSSAYAWIAFAGVLAALALAQRTIGFYLLLFLPCALIWLAPDKGHITRRIVQSVILLAVAGLVLAGFKARNGKVFGEDSLTRGSGIHLHNRITHTHDKFPPNEEADRMAEIVRRHGVDPDKRFNAWDVFDALKWKEGLSYAEADKLMATASKKAFFHDPTKLLRDTFVVMGESCGYNPPFNEWGPVWMAEGIRPENFDTSLRTAEKWWPDSLDLVNRYRSEFQPYPPRQWLGSLPLLAMEGLGHFGAIFAGRWLLVVLPLAFLYGVIRRRPVVVLGIGMAFGLLGASAFGERPEIRFWIICAPFFFLGMSGIVQDLIDWSRGRKQQSERISR